jgi:hypothetical protein
MKADIEFCVGEEKERLISNILKIKKLGSVYIDSSIVVMGGCKFLKLVL